MRPGLCYSSFDTKLFTNSLSGFLGHTASPPSVLDSVFIGLLVYLANNEKQFALLSQQLQKADASSMCPVEWESPITASK